MWSASAERENMATAIAKTVITPTKTLGTVILSLFSLSRIGTHGTEKKRKTRERGERIYG